MWTGLLRAGPAALIVAASCAVAGCTAAVADSTVPASTAPASTASASAEVAIPTRSARPADSLGLAAYGLIHGPAAFGLPAGLLVEERVDQPNVVTLIFTPDSAATLAGWLTTHLEGMGYRVDASSHDSVVFTGSGWSGAFTGDSQIAGLTLRRDGT